MKINFKTSSRKDIYQVGNTIENCARTLWLIADNVNGGYSVVNLTTNQIFGTYDTLEDLIRNVGDESDILFSERMHQVDNTIENDDDLYLMATNPEGKFFAVNLRTDLVYGPYTTTDDLYWDVCDEDDALAYIGYSIDDQETSKS